MAFSHIGDGQLFAGSERFIQTTIILVNSSVRFTTGTLEFFDNDGQPLDLTIDGVTASSFPFEMNGRETRRFMTSGEGETKSGWARVHSEQPLSGTASFGIRDREGTIYTEVGVAESEFGKSFTLFTDSVGAVSTGVAVANPDFTNGITLVLELFDSAGQMLATTTRNLAPGGHLARFIDELFPGVEGIDEFEGSIILSSEDAFTGITLRTIGEQFTSMPMIPSLPEGANWTNLAFPHLGEGIGNGLQMRTTIVLFNNTGSPASGRIDFLASSGDPLPVSIGGRLDSSFSFELQPRAVLRLVTDGTGELRSGWAEATMDQPIDGTALFTIFDTQGSLLTEVAVPSAFLYQSFELIADSLGAFNTGIALANPAASGEPVTIEFRLDNSLGVFQTFERRTLGPREHTAFFLNDLFADLPGDADIEEFEGKLQISASGWVAPLCLRQADIKLTSMPTLLARPGFAPGSEVQLGQKLSGGSPAFLWKVFQPADELSMAKVKLSALEIGVNQDLAAMGQTFAVGLAWAGGEDQTLDLQVSEKGSTKFQVITADRYGRRITASGNLEGDLDGGFQLEILFQENEAYSLTGSDVNAWLFFPPGLILVPEGTESVEFSIEFTSVSRDPDRELPILRRLTQMESFQAPSAEYPNINSIEPLFLDGGGVAVVKGSNFVEPCEVLLRTRSNFRARVLPAIWSSSELRRPVACSRDGALRRSLWAIGGLGDLLFDPALPGAGFS